MTFELDVRCRINRHNHLRTDQVRSDKASALRLCRPIQYFFESAAQRPRPGQIIPRERYHGASCAAWNPLLKKKALGNIAFAAHALTKGKCTRGERSRVDVMMRAINLWLGAGPEATESWRRFPGTNSVKSWHSPPYCRLTHYNNCPSSLAPACYKFIFEKHLWTLLGSAFPDES